MNTSTSRCVLCLIFQKNIIAFLLIAHDRCVSMHSASKTTKHCACNSRNSACFCPHFWGWGFLNQDFFQFQPIVWNPHMVDLGKAPGAVTSFGSGGIKPPKTPPLGEISGTSRANPCRTLRPKWILPQRKHVGWCMGSHELFFWTGTR